MGLDWHLQNKKDGTTPRMHVAAIMGMKGGNEEGVLDFLVEEERWRWFREFASLREQDVVHKEQIEEILENSTTPYVEAWEHKETYPTDAIAFITGLCCGDFDFRGKVVSRNELVSHAESAECYEDMDPSRMKDFGVRLWDTVKISLEADGISVPKNETEMGELGEQHPQAYYLSRAAKWLMFWGEAGFSMEVSY